LSALRPTDYLFTNYREHGYAIMRGIDPKRVMAELYGRVDGVSKGWGGSMHMFDVTHRLLGGYGIVGGQLPLATGAALAIDYRGGDEVVMCTLGDGTTAIGAFHESLNIAALWHLPVVFVIINNGLGMGTTVAKSSAEPELYKRGAAYRMESARVDGAGAVQAFWRISLPMIRPALAVCTVEALILSLNIFDQVYILNGIAPLGSSVMLQTYLTTFQNLNFGGGYALSLLMTVATAVLSMAALALLYRRPEAA